MDKLNYNRNENSTTFAHVGRCLDKTGRLAYCHTAWWGGINNNIGDVFVGEIKFKQDCSHA